MFVRTFNPGPSQISEAVKADIAAASGQNILSISHRSSAFTAITQEAIEGLRQYFAVPDDYHILLTSSATEALELTIRNLVEETSFHFTNGHFSELFAATSRAFGKTAVVDAAVWGEQNDHEHAVIPAGADIVTVTYNETSTGVTCDNRTISRLRRRVGKSLLVVDITSVAGCLPVEIAEADVWLFSVQKGLGLPSGLGVMFLSPRALERSRQVSRAGLFNFSDMASRMEEHQTIHTPNVLGIYLLAKQLTRWNSPGAASNYTATRAKAKLLADFVGAHKQLEYFVREPAVRSKTTVCIAAEPDVIEALHAAAKRADMIIGNGYGKLKAGTCRIATFPALSVDDMKLLISSLAPALQ